MKKGFFALAGLFLLFSCNDASKEGKVNDDFSTQAKLNSEHTKEVYRAIETGDVSKLDSFIAADIIDHASNNGKDVVGIDSLKHHLSKIHTYFDNLKSEIISEATSLDGQYHYSMYRMRGTAKQNPWGMPVGMEMDDTGIDVVKIRDGKAAEHWSFSSQEDINEMMAAMSGGNKIPAARDSANR
jgi:ketosteroid isomerase-like protein